MKHKCKFTAAAFIRKNSRFRIPHWDFALGAMKHWHVQARFVSFEKTPKIFGKLVGNDFCFKPVIKLAHFFFKLTNLCMQISSFFFDLGKFIFEKKKPLFKD